MTKFNPQNKDILTYEDCLAPAMKITDPMDAEQYFLEYVYYIQKLIDPEDDDKSAYDIAKINLGYYAGYYDSETRYRVEKLFSCSHPIFGSIKENGWLTPKQAFDAGVKYAETQMRKEKIKKINHEN